MKDRIDQFMKSSKQEGSNAMGKNTVSKRSKGKVDFKRKEDPEDPDKKAADDNDEERKIVFLMKKCKVMMLEANDS